MAQNSSTACDVLNCGAGDILRPYRGLEYQTLDVMKKMFLILSNSTNRSKNGL